jgi:hypothetical protein
LGDTYASSSATRLIRQNGFLYQSAMKKRGVKPMKCRPIPRFGFSLMGLMFIAVGTLALPEGKTHYENYWEGQFSLRLRFSSVFYSWSE